MSPNSPKYVVIFQARIAALDNEYFQLAEMLRARAINQYGCIRFTSCCENDNEIALSYWPDRESIRRWANDAEHRRAQQLGHEKWYESVQVEIAELPA